MSNYYSMSFMGIVADVVVIPLAPSSVNITQDSNANSFDVSWVDNSSNEVTFDIQYEVNFSDVWESWGTAAANATSKNNNVVGVSYQATLHGKQVSVRVRATNANGSSAWVEDASPVTASFTAPTTPTTFTVTEIPSGRINGTYSNVTNETGYEIDLNEDGNGFLFYENNAADDVSTTQFDPFDYALGNGQTVQMRVRASRYGAFSAFRTSNIEILANQPNGK